MSVIFSPDQQMAMLEWLEYQQEAGLELKDVIDGLEKGILTTTTGTFGSGTSTSSNSSITQ